MSAKRCNRKPCGLLFPSLLLFLFLATPAFAETDSHGLALVEAASLRGHATGTAFSFGMTSGQSVFLAEAETSADIEVVAHIYPAAADNGKTADLFVVAMSPAGLYMRDGLGRFIPWNGKPADLASAYEDVTLVTGMAVTLFSGRHDAEGSYRYYVGYSVIGGDDLVYSPKAGKFNAVRAAQALLWRVSNGVNEIFVGGTIHLLAPEHLPPPAPYLDAYANSDILVTEIDPDDLDNLADLAILFLNPSGQTLQTLLSPVLYAALRDYLALAGENIANYNVIHPNWVVVTLQNLEFGKFGYADGVDNYFMELAQADGRSNLGLESVASQILTIRNLSPALSAEEIIGGTLAAIFTGALIQSLAGDISAWINADIAHFEAEIARDKVENRFDHDLLLTNRNASWIPQLELFLATPAVEYVLVGTAHVVGEDSILRMLEDRGYTVERY